MQRYNVVPLVVGMNPSPRVPENGWSPDAASTQLISEFVLGDPDRGRELDEGLELDNLNASVPAGCEKRVRVDTQDAFATLDRWLEEGKLASRQVLLLGKEVTENFLNWLGEFPSPEKDVWTSSSASKAPGLRIASLPHPGRIIRLRGWTDDRWKKELEEKERRFSVIAAHFFEGQDIRRSEALRLESEFAFEERTLAEEIRIQDENDDLAREEEALAYEIYLEARRDYLNDLLEDDRWERADEAIATDWWYGDD